MDGVTGDDTGNGGNTGDNNQETDPYRALAEGGGTPWQSSGNHP